MSSDHYFYDVPVYRVSEEVYYAARKRAVESQLSIVQSYYPTGHELPRHTAEGVAQRDYERFGPWRFNEQIGHIRLHLLGSQIRGEYFSAEKHRNPIGRTKLFTYRTHKLAPEVDIERPFSNEQIWAAILEYVADCRDELRKARVVDSALLEAIGPFVNWRAVFGWPPLP